MGALLKTRVVKAENTYAIRIPRRLLDLAGFGEAVWLEARPGEILVRASPPARPPREGWDEQFAAMAQRGDDQVLDPESS